MNDPTNTSDVQPSTIPMRTHTLTVAADVGDAEELENILHRVMDYISESLDADVSFDMTVTSADGTWADRLIYDADSQPRDPFCHGENECTNPAHEGLHK